MTAAPSAHRALAVRQALTVAAAFALVVIAAALNRVWGRFDAVEFLIALAKSAWALLFFLAAIGVIVVVLLALFSPRRADRGAAQVFPFRAPGPDQ